MMRFLMTNIRRFLADESGPTTAEYAVMLALIVVVLLPAVQLLGCRANFAFLRTGQAIRP